jgi:hypothetical protein
MKRSALTVIVFLAFSLFLAGVASAQKTETVTGKVTAVDPEGKGIVVMKGTGYWALDRGVIVSPDTVIKVKGKKAALGSIKVGDKVTVKLQRSTDLYAKQIIRQ